MQEVYIIVTVFVDIFWLEVAAVNASLDIPRLPQIYCVTSSLSLPVFSNEHSKPLFLSLKHK
jgi:hypothetical protein